MSNTELYEKIGEAVINPSWELSTEEVEQVKVKEIISQEVAARFIAHVQSKMAGGYHKGAVYTGTQVNIES